MWLLENTVTSCPNWYLELETVAAAFYENVPRRYLHQRQNSLLTVRTKSLILLPFIFIDWEIHRCWTDATFCYDENANLSRQAETGAGIKQQFMYTAPFHTQVTILLLRALTTIWREKVQFLGLLFPILILLISSSFQTIRFWLGCALFFTYSWRLWWAFSTGKSETTLPSYLTMLAWFFSTRYSFFTPL